MRTPKHLIDDVARCLGITREQAESLSLLTVADLRRVGVIRDRQVLETHGESLDAWVAR